ncbi:hypothetical protein BU17DRAFT_39117 [Hysterangium stoloniferum]|nr:hypothetical protein BU17DRAFT_39117 [Hysterangium stoloniferum]
MVKLTLSSTKGTGARVFPHAGFLALTPLKIEGVVRTRLDEDNKYILASDVFVAVRCYEARIGRAGVSQTNLLVDYCMQLWSKPAGEQWAELGNGEWPFRLVLPPKVAGQGYSTASFQEYRVFWRVEAVLNHIPMTGLGSRQVKTYDLPLMRYDAGEPLPLAPSTWAQVGSSKSPTSLRYIINTPPFSLGPLELLPVSLKLSPSGPTASVHSVELAIERRLEFNHFPRDVASIDLNSTTNLVERPPPSPKSSSSSTFSSSSKVNTSIIASVDASDIPRDEKTGLFMKTVTLQIPAQKSSSHWAIGQTMQTPLVTLRFFLRIKVTLSTFESFDLAERELTIVSANESDRRQAMNMVRARSRDAARLPSPPPSPKAPRRPHTSSGPGTGRAKKSRSSRGTDAGTGGNTSGFPLPSPPSSLSPSFLPPHSPTSLAAEYHSFTPAHSPLPASSDCNSTSNTNNISDATPSTTNTNTADSFLSSPPPTSQIVQAWEEELERIAAQSRRRSAEMRGGSMKEKGRRIRMKIGIGIGIGGRG